ncbi:MAG: prolipoprotein diacylglyceryl transferase [Actinobacteria bacterium]|nr:prolipoprotein diacylglyceryl transferase [Actinomycetota bacterium]
MRVFAIPGPYSEFVFPEAGLIRWWGVMLTLGIVAGAWLAARGARRTGLDARHVIPLLIVTVLAGLLGARTYYVGFEWTRRFAAAPELAGSFWQG